MPTDILALSWKVQVALASGYAAYIIAYRGVRSHHTAQDQVFLTLVFSLVATAGLYWWASLNPVLSGAAAFSATLAAGLLWRRQGVDRLRDHLRDSSSTWSDDTPSAWARIMENRQHPLSQITVFLTDGTVIECDDTSRFADCPWGPCILGNNGDVLMYPTSITRKDGEPRPQATTLDDFGDRITYIPGSQIARINLRHQHPGINRRRAAASTAGSEAAL